MKSIVVNDEIAVIIIHFYLIKVEVILVVSCDSLMEGLAIPSYISVRNSFGYRLNLYDGCLSLW